jgi:hypothetical protein
MSIHHIASLTDKYVGLQLKRLKIGLGYGSSGRSTSRGPEFKPQYQKKKKKKKKRKCI